MQARATSKQNKTKWAREASQSPKVKLVISEEKKKAKNPKQLPSITPFNWDKKFGLFMLI